MKKIEYLDFDWYYQRDFKEEFVQPRLNREDLRDWQQVSIPHSNHILPHSYFDEGDFAFVSAYRRDIRLPEKGSDRQYAYLRFEGVMGYAEVYWNGQLIASHKGGYTPFNCMLPDELTYWDRHNHLLVKCDSTEREDIPPFGNLIDYLTYGGIYREVSLHICHGIDMRNLKVTPVIYQPEQISGPDSKVAGHFLLDAYIANPLRMEGDIRFSIGIEEIGYSQEFKLHLTGEEYEQLQVKSIQISDLELWDIGQGRLYQLDWALDKVDRGSVKTGFRDAEFRPDGFWLNGRYVKLMGLNRHQSYPYAGYAMPARAQRKDADILADFGCNIVRTSHYPQLPEFIDRCDELGLLVFTETPGWQHIGAEDWKEQVLVDVRSMIERDYNHPSIVLWGVRINESMDDSQLYQKTNALARQLDPNRQTGGVRYIDGSEFLEDVYTMNDFVLNGGAVALRGQHEVTRRADAVPYLVTESNGHMFPTKAWDPEERRIEHAKRHLRVVDAALSCPQHSGSISWCAFDYNTHHEFGAGDKICHHGVFSMYRHPKFAAWAYRSQKDPSQEVVLEPLTAWARGERDACMVAPITVLHNCEYIEFWMRGEMQGRYFPARSLYKGLAHPPSIIEHVEGTWGMILEDMEIKGFIDGKEVASKKFLANTHSYKLELKLDDAQIGSSRPDATRLSLQVLDQVGNTLPFFMGAVRLTIQGAKVQVYADEVLERGAALEVTSILRGGASAIWLVSQGQIGDLVINAQVVGNPVCQPARCVLKISGE